MYGRQFFLHFAPTYFSQSDFVNNVHGCHECKKCHRCRIYVEFYGNRLAFGNYFLGKYAFTFRKSTADRCLVDYFGAGNFSRRLAFVFNWHWKLFSQKNNWRSSRLGKQRKFYLKKIKFYVISCEVLWKSKVILVNGETLFCRNIFQNCFFAINKGWWVFSEIFVIKFLGFFFVWT